MSTNHVVVFGAEHDNTLGTALSAAGWSVQAVRTVASLAALKNHETNPACGLLLADARFLKQLNVLRNALTSSEIEWIVVLEPAQLEHHEVRMFVDECCYDFHHLPIDLNRLLVTLGRLHGKALLRNQLLLSKTLPTSELIGNHPLMLRLKHDIHRIARSRANALITGESGTGKELVAHTIHRLSDRSQEVFQVVNCGALPGGLVQSELFGYERGAFTGASERRRGRIEVASGGILFLDEIGDMALEAQINLLRFLQEGTIERLGSPHSVGVDVRVLSATHVDLQKKVMSGTFREDLYYRLNVCCIHIPPLRARQSDILPLAQYLIARHAKTLGVPRRRLTEESAKALIKHSWPGNVRELANRLTQGLVMASGRYIKPGDMGLEEGREIALSTLDKERDAVEREAIKMAMAINQGNRSKVANHLGVSRATLYRLLNKYQLLEID